MIPAFDPLPWLYLKEWALLAACAMAAAGLLDAGGDSSPVRGRPAAAFCLSLVLGMAGLLASGYLALRLALILGLPRPFMLSVMVIVAVAAAGFCLFVLRQIVRPLRSRAEGQERARPRGLGVAFVVLLLMGCGLVPLLPLALDGDIAFYAGVGTDSTGYIRAARSMTEGWFFDPLPAATISDVLYHTDRAWTYGLMAYRDRPATFYLVAVVATLGRLDPFQAYLAVESMAVVTFAAFVAFLLLRCSRSGGLFVAGALLSALGLVLLSGMTGNLFRQFLGHAWSIVTGVVLAPTVFWATAGTGRASIVRVSLAAFVVTLIAIGVYDVRVAVFTLGTCLAAWALVFGRRDAKKIVATMAMAGIAAIAASLIGGSARKDLAMLRRFNLNLFPDVRFSLPGFVHEAGLQMEPTMAFGIALAVLSLSFLVVQASVLREALRARRNEPADREDFWFFSSYAFFVWLGSLVAVVMLAWGGNGWAAHKTLYSTAAAQAATGTLSLVALGNRGRRWLAIGMGLAILACAVVSVRSAWRWARAVVEAPATYGVIATDGLVKVGAELQELRPQVVWFEGNVLEWLVFYSYLHDKPWVTLAPFPLWYHGGGLFQRVMLFPALAPKAGEHPDVALKRLYADGLARPEVRGAEKVVAVVARDAGAEWPQANCGRPYCVVQTSTAELLRRAGESSAKIP